MSFADGFTQGFGLIQNVKQQNDRMKLERERLAEQRRQADLTYDVQLRNNDIKSRLASIEEKLSDPRSAQITSSANLNEARAGSINFDTLLNQQFGARERQAGLDLTGSRIGLNQANTRLTDARTGLTDFEAEGVRLRNAITGATGMDRANAELNQLIARTRGLNIDNRVQEATALDRALAEIAGVDVNTYLTRMRGEGQATENEIRAATGMEAARADIADTRAGTAGKVAATEGQVLENEITAQEGLNRERAEIASIEAGTEARQEGTRGDRLANDITEEFGSDREQAEIASIESSTRARDESTRGLASENDALIRQNNLIAGAEALQLMDDMAEDVIEGTTSPEDWKRAAAANRDTILEAGFIFDPTVEFTAQQFMTDLVEGNFEASSGVDLLNKMVKPSNRYNVGQTVTEQFVNAPDVMRDGTFKVIQSGVGRLHATSDGTGATADVLTVIEGPDGEQYPYLAPATVGRSPAEREQLVIKEEAFSPALQAMLYAKESMRGSENNFKRAARIAEFGPGPEGAQAFNDRVAAEMEKMTLNSENFPDIKSPISGMRLRDFVELEGGDVMKRHFERTLLFTDGEEREFTIDDYERHMTAVRNSKEGQLVAARVVGRDGTPLTNKELELVQILDFSKKGNKRKYLPQIIQTIKRRRLDAGVDVRGGSLMVGSTDVSNQGE